MVATAAAAAVAVAAAGLWSPSAGNEDHSRWSFLALQGSAARDLGPREGREKWRTKDKQMKDGLKEDN